MSACIHRHRDTSGHRTMINDAANDPSVREEKPERLLRLAEVIARVGLAKTTIYDHIRAGMFPKPVDLGGAVAWVESEIDAWIAARIAARDKVA